MTIPGFLASVVLALVPIVAGCASDPVLAPARTEAASASVLPDDLLLAQTPAPTVPAPPVPAPSVPAQAAPAAPAPAPEAPRGLPRVRDYRAIPELRDIYFDFGKAVIRPGDARILDANAAWLRANPDQLLLIEGHCDDRGVTNRKNELNMSLGERRAQAAMNHLVAQGVQPSRIIVLSYGEERPVCNEQSERCWSQNRRSRFLVKPR
jgi:peptidoglycan-associated lipoprotein